ncbi:hypothetical protein ACHAWF_004966 [Thalassiosira exigua]
MKYLEDSRLARLTADLSGASLNTRGSGGAGGGGGRPSLPAGRGGRRGKRSGGSTSGRGCGGAPPSSLYSYSPEGYCGCGGGGSSPSSSSVGSCRVIHGRVEAYTTKRAGSDKRTAHAVGERYAREMERLNEAVEALKKKHALERQKKEGEKEEDGKEIEESQRPTVRRTRSRSLDGVTFAATASPEVLFDKSQNSASILAQTKPSDLQQPALEPLEEGVATNGKRAPPMPEGILKKPTGNKRCRATSFDVSTGPSTLSPHRPYHRHESSSSLPAGAAWGDSYAIHALEGDVGGGRARPLIPQPSLYRSSLGDSEQGTGRAGAGGGTSAPTMVPRRLVTDLVLTLNASFPDYDFGSARVTDFCTLPLSAATADVNSRLGEFAATTDGGRDFLPRLWNALDDVLFGLRECEVYSYAPGGGAGEDGDPLEFLTASMAGRGEEEEATAAALRPPAPSAAAGAGGVTYSPDGGGRIVSDETLPSLEGVDPPCSPSSDPSGHVTIWSANYLFVSKNKKRVVLFACVQTARSPQGGDEDCCEVGDESEYAENDPVFDEARRGLRGEGTRRAYEEEIVVKSSWSRDKAETYASAREDETVVVEDMDCEAEEGAEDGEGEGEGGDFEALGISVGVPSHVV